MIAFSAKVRPAHGDLPAPSTIEASGIEAPALPGAAKSLWDFCAKVQKRK
jgi:hypothetical protein